MSHMSQSMSLSLTLSLILSQCLTSVSARPIEINEAQSQSGCDRTSMEVPVVGTPKLSGHQFL